MPQCDSCDIELKLVDEIWNCRKCGDQWNQVSLLGSWVGYTKGYKVVKKTEPKSSEVVVVKEDKKEVVLEKAPPRKDEGVLQKEKELPKEEPLVTNAPVVVDKNPEVSLGESESEQKKLKELEDIELKKQAEVLKQKEEEETKQKLEETRKRDAEKLKEELQKKAAGLRELLIKEVESVEELRNHVKPKDAKPQDIVSLNNTLKNAKELTKSKELSDSDFVSKAQLELEALQAIHKKLQEEVKDGVKANSTTINDFIAKKKYPGASASQLELVQKLQTELSSLPERIKTGGPTTRVLTETNEAAKKINELRTDIDNRAKFIRELEKLPQTLLEGCKFKPQVEDALLKHTDVKTLKQLLSANTSTMEVLKETKVTVSNTYTLLVNEQEALLKELTEYWATVSGEIVKVRKGFVELQVDPFQVIESKLNRIEGAATSKQPLSRSSLDTEKAAITSRLEGVRNFLDRLKGILDAKTVLDLSGKSQPLLGFLNLDDVFTEQWKEALKSLVSPSLDVKALNAVGDRVQTRRDFLLKVKVEQDKLKSKIDAAKEAIKLTRNPGLYSRWEELNEIFATEPLAVDALEKAVSSIDTWLKQLASEIVKERDRVEKRGAALRRTTFTVDSRCVKVLKGVAEARIAFIAFAGAHPTSWNQHSLGKKAGHDWSGWNSIQYNPKDGNYVLIYKFEGSKLVVGSAGQHQSNTYKLSPDPELGMRPQTVAIAEYKDNELEFDWL